MIGKLVRFALKILPLITLYKGLTSGGARLKPMLDIGKVALTQYELGQITKLSIQNYKENNGQLIHPDDFSYFLNDHFSNNYSSLLRKMLGNKPPKLSYDIWQTPFRMQTNPSVTRVVFSSAGPDKKFNTKDDLGLDFVINRRGPASRAPANFEVSEAEQKESPYEQYDSEGYNRDGYDRNGYDRDGYDRDGIHYSEKNL